MVEGKTVTTDHPIAYVSGLFRSNQRGICHLYVCKETGLLLQTTVSWFMQTVTNWFSPLAMQDDFALFAGSLVPSCRKLALVLGNGCERFCASRPLLGSYVHQESI